METWGFPLSSTELIKNAKSEPGPFMPMELAGHAHVEINSTDSMIVGKYSSGFSIHLIYFSTIVMINKNKPKNPLFSNQEDGLSKVKHLQKRFG